MSDTPLPPEPPETPVARSGGNEAPTNGAATNGDGASLKDLYDDYLVRCDTALRDGAPLPPLPAELANTPFAPQAESGVRLLKLLARARDTVMGTEPPAQAGAAPLERVGPFRLVRELGRGGHGVVYLAVDERLGRQVALKLSRPETLLDPDLRKRFLREAQAAGQLDHPQLVPVHEVGEEGRLFYIASQYVEGKDLAQWLAEQTAPVPPRQAAELVAALADGVEHAHAHGVLHRDIKPSNVLLSEESGRLLPRLTDFGLAKLLEAKQDQTQTRTGVLLGTPTYMAPELATGKLRDVGPATDVYGLGTLLYEILAGRPPFRGENDVDTIRQVANDEPLEPQRLRPGLPAELVAICLKCLEKRPESRYHSAAHLADDLRRYLDGQPTVARPTTHMGRAWKVAKRRPATAGLSIALMAAACLLVVGGTWMGSRLARSLEDARTALTQKDRALELARASSSDAYLAVGLAAISNRDYSTAMKHFGNAAEAAPDAERHTRAVRCLNAWSQVLWLPVHTFQTPRREPFAVLSEHARVPNYVNALRFSSDSAFLTSRLEDGRLYVIDVTSGQVRTDLAADAARCSAVSADGDTLAWTSNGLHITIFSLRAGRKIADFQAPGLITRLAFSDDGKHLIAAGDRIWAYSFDRAVVLPQSVSVSGALAFSFVEGGAIVLACFAERDALPLELGPEGLVSSAARASLPHRFHTGSIGVRGYPPMTIGTLAIATPTLGASEWFDTLSGQVVRSAPQPGAATGAYITTLARTLSGRRLLVGGHRYSQLWDTEGSGTLIATIDVTRYALSAEFTPDNAALIIGDNTGRARFYSALDGAALSPDLQHDSEVVAVGTSQQGLCCTATSKGIVTIWKRGCSYPITRVYADTHHTHLAISEDGRRFVPTGCVRDARLARLTVRDVESGKQLGREWHAPSEMVSCAFIDDEAHDLCAALCRGNDAGSSLALVNWQTGDSVATIALPTLASPMGCAASPGGLFVVVLMEDGDCFVVDVKARAIAARVHCGTQAARYYGRGWVRFGRRDDYCVLSGLRGGSVVLGLKPARVLAQLPAGTVSIDCDFCRTDDTFVTCSLEHPDGGNATIWKIMGEEVSKVAEMAHPNWVFSARFDPGGQRVVTAGRDGKLRVWSVEAAELLATPISIGDEAWVADFVLDGTLVIAAGAGRAVSVYDWKTGIAVAPPRYVYGGYDLVINPERDKCVTFAHHSLISVINIGRMFERPIEFRVPVGTMVDRESENRPGDRTRAILEPRAPVEAWTWGARSDLLTDSLTRLPTSDDCDASRSTVRELLHAADQLSQIGHLEESSKMRQLAVSMAGRVFKVSERGKSDFEWLSGVYRSVSEALGRDGESFSKGNQAELREEVRRLLDEPL